MPELPEVETVVTSLRPFLVGQTIQSLSYCDWPATLSGREPEPFGRQVSGRRVEDIRRRAKHILIELDSGQMLALHLRMTGQLVFHGEPAEPQKATRLIFDLDGGSQLHFRDARKFGRVRLLDPDEVDPFLAHLGPEPLVEEFTLESFRRLLAGRRSRLKPTLLDQSFLAGVGNIYADEALFRARLHPLRRLDTLEDDEVGALHEAIRFVLQQGVDNRGTTVDSYRDARGEKGSNQERLAVYGRAGQPCLRCGTPIERMVVGGRGTYICPSCQK